MRATTWICLPLLAALGCTAGRVGQRDLDAGGGRDAGDRRDGGTRDGDTVGRDSGAPDGGTDAGPSDVETICSDGIDNDGDLITDCDDPDCDGRICNVDGLLCGNGTCSCGSEAAETSCGDGIDDDCDGMTDCADPECDGAECGPGPVVCAASVCPCPDGFTERSCGNGADDDCDGMTDCDDADCLGLDCGGMDGFFCTAPMMCTCPGLGMPEVVCDGTDENCNGTVDEGCPTGIARPTSVDLGPSGNGGGTPFADPCPDGAALIGLAGQAPSTLEQLRPICANMVFVENTDPLLHEYSVRRGTPVDGAAHGRPGAETFREVCPGESFAVGVSGDADFSVDRVRLACAELSIGFTGLMRWRLTIAPAGFTPFRGSLGTTTSPFSQACAPDQVITGVRGQETPTRVSQLGVTCTTLALSIR